MENNSESKVSGFAGLASLASDIVETLVKAETFSKENSAVDSRSIDESKAANKTPTGSISSWKIAVAVCAVVLLFAYKMEIFSSSVSYVSSSSKSQPTRTAQPSVKKPSQTSSTKQSQSVTDSKYVTEKPPVGEGRVLSRAQIRWCHEQEIRLTAMKTKVDTFSETSVNIFNRQVDDYNSRCGSFRYRGEDLESAEREVEKRRAEIWKEGLLEAVLLGVEIQKNLPKPTPKTTAAATTPKPSVTPKPKETTEPDKQILQVQQLLSDLGYKPGPVDGKYGSRTAEAIKEFQKNNGMRQTGTVDRVLLFKLHFEKSKKDA